MVKLTKTLAAEIMSLKTGTHEVPKFKLNSILILLRIRQQKHRYLCTLVSCLLNLLLSLCYQPTFSEDIGIENCEYNYWSEHARNTYMPCNQDRLELGSQK